MTQSKFSTSPSKELFGVVEVLDKPIQQIVQNYLNCTDRRDVSPTGMLNWFAMKPRGGGNSAFENKDVGGIGKDFLIDRQKQTDILSKNFKDREKLSVGRAHDAMILSVSNDIIAQIEAAANFRRNKVSSHFAKSRFDIEQMGKGAKAPKYKESILEEYTTGFINNAIKYTAGQDN